MNTRLIQLPIFLFFISLSSLAFAGGEGCSSTKGHGEISAEVLKNHDQKHFWSKFFEQHNNNDMSAGHDSKIIEKHGKNSTSGLIES